MSSRLVNDLSLKKFGKNLIDLTNEQRRELMADPEYHDAVNGTSYQQDKPWFTFSYVEDDRYGKGK